MFLWILRSHSVASEDVFELLTFLGCVFLDPLTVRDLMALRPSHGKMICCLGSHWKVMKLAMISPWFLHPGGTIFEGRRFSEISRLVVFLGVARHRFFPTLVWSLAQLAEIAGHVHALSNLGTGYGYMIIIYIHTYIYTYLIYDYNWMNQNYGYEILISISVWLIPTVYSYLYM